LQYIKSGLLQRIYAWGVGIDNRFIATTSATSRITSTAANITATNVT